MNDNIDTNDEAQFDDDDRPTKTSTSRRTFIRAAGVSAGALALGTSTVAAQEELPTVTVALADEQLEAGETTTATVTVTNFPAGSEGINVELGVDPDIALITEVELGEHGIMEGLINNDIEEAGGVSSAQVNASTSSGIDADEYELATYHLEAQGNGTTELELVDFTLTTPENELVEEAAYDAPTLTVGDGPTDPVAPAMPTDLEVVAENETSVDVEWSPVSDAVEYAVSVDGEQRLTTTSNGATLTGLEADTDYEIGVSAVGENGDESDTATVSATTTEGDQPVTPTLTVNLDDATIDPGETTAVDIGLSEAPDGLSGFSVDVGVDPEVSTVADAELGAPFADVSDLITTVETEAGAATLSAADANANVQSGAADVEFGRIELEGVADGETLVEVESYEVKDEVDIPVEPTIEEATLTVGDGEPDTEPPSVPEELEVVAEAETSIDVAWRTDPNAEEYVVSVDGEQRLTAAASSATVSELEPGTTYEIGVSAVGADGTETDPATISATTAEADVPPSTPEGLEVVSESETSIDVAWSSDPNAVEYAVSVDGEWQFTTSATDATVSGLESGTTYEIGVSAVGEDGTETGPATVSATTAESDEGGNGEGGDSEYPEWDSSTLYQSGDRVHWNGDDWEAQWTNRGEEPMYEDFYAWEPVSGEIPLEVEYLAKLDPSATTVETGERIDFHVVDTSGDQNWIEGLEWDLGDGTSASGWYAGHSYESSGTYTVTLTARDQRGRETTHEVTINVS